MMRLKFAIRGRGEFGTMAMRHWHARYMLHDLPLSFAAHLVCLSCGGDEFVESWPGGSNGWPSKVVLYEISGEGVRVTQENPLIMVTMRRTGNHPSDDES